MQLRKIIRESIEEVNTENMLQQIGFLKGFDCINSSGGVWEYHKKTRSDGYYLHVIIKGGERWTMSLDTHWNKLSDENTSNMGREYKMDFGPYESLGEMIEDVNRRLKNNPIISPDVHEDDQSFEFKKELVDMLERLGEIGVENLSSSIGRDAGFDDIVEICSLIQGKSRRELAKFVKKEYSGSSDQQKLYSILQKMERMDFHADMGRMMYENMQLADKVYFKTGIFSPEDKEKILSVTKGNNYTKAIADIDKIFAHRFSEKDLMRFQNWLIEYNKNILPIKDFDINNIGSEQAMSFRDRSDCIKQLESIPSVYLRNMKPDMRIERNSGEFMILKSHIDTISNSIRTIEKYAPENRELICKKIFNSHNKTFKSVIKPLQNIDEYLIKSSSSKEEISDIVETLGYDDAEIVFDGGDTMVVQVNNSEAIKTIAAGSLWCFVIESGDMYWYEYTGIVDYVYIIFDFSEPINTPNRMLTLCAMSNRNGVISWDLYDGNNESYEIDYLTGLGIDTSFLPKYSDDYSGRQLFIMEKVEEILDGKYFGITLEDLYAKFFNDTGVKNYENKINHNFQEREIMRAFNDLKYNKDQPKLFENKRRNHL